ncbi:hypothetical protein P3X46_004191 [Hevea brasiliensis]|uniref:BZIP domain-containing protein n=1 Tax=Hevea brasiliensis TaxID=3981 RepID=A0ABQ9MWE8_HEVBR|nr:protein ABSCISIC ACID-INSENSITIVE 5 isoform X1 [Hevea brasiliensis]XP_021670052.2 protein ABSCISIC ACID-INSENSITIVE 5 isoform X1 [Hevea brasiliensis]KAJ9184466.1 hypothetical protein P3X46_004191 [Hevea brasiliensis]
MVVTESEEISQGEVESPLQPDHHLRNHTLLSLGRQSSIYSLTLDEFQHTLCESGKNFGSMNMDEFLASIWNAEEHQQANNGATTNNDQINNSNNNKGTQVFNDFSGDRVISKRPSLPRQGSISLPAPLCRKTVDEVWSEMHREQEQELQNQGQGHSNGNNMQNNPESAAPWQPTFGEMTLEDFLIKAGVVRQQCPAASVPRQQQQYGMYQSNNNKPSMGTGFVSRPVLGIGSGSGVGAVSYQTMPQGAGPVGETSGRNGGFPPQAAAATPGSVYGGRVGNGGGYAPSQAMGVMGQVSPVSSDAMVSSGIDNAANQFGIDVGGLRGRKRIVDGPVEKLVERRQRRMIKNRESAARSRARKQAYTVELEAELSQLKEENKQLRRALAELERKRKQQHLEKLRMKAQSKGQKAKEKLRIMRRNFSCLF